MIWVIPKTKRILLGKGALYFFAITLYPSKRLSQNCRNSLDRCKQLLKKSMYQFQEFITDLTGTPLQSQETLLGSIPDNKINFFRRARSEENFHTSTYLSPWWIDPHLFYEEPYSSAQTNSSSIPEGHFSGNTLNFTPPLELTIQDLIHIPSPSMPSNGRVVPHSSRGFLSPQNVQNTQKRYYLRKASSADNSPTKNLDDIPEILKVMSKRCWEQTGTAKTSSKRCFEFTLMSYNVLAQDLLNEHPYLYKEHNPKALNWELRWKNLFNEIKTMRPDVLCLQEVQQSHLTSYYNQLKLLGYQGLYKKRTGIRCDGCAIYYKPDRLDLVEYETVEFYQPKVAVLNRDNIAIIAKLCPRHSPKHQFIVATTHLLYNPRRQDVRLAQTQLLLTEVERMSFHWNSKGNEKYWPIIITGDFNSTPDSVVYELITKGTVKYEHLAARVMNRPESPKQGNVLVPNHLQITDTCQHAGLVRRRNKNEDLSRTEEAALIKLHNSDKTVTKISAEIINNPYLFSSGSLCHLFALKSVYCHGEPSNPEGSTFQDKWITVDYIFYSGKKRADRIDDHKLKLLSRYRLPLKSELGTMMIPNSLIGSDHLSLVAKFAMKL